MITLPLLFVRRLGLTVRVIKVLPASKNELSALFVEFDTSPFTRVVRTNSVYFTAHLVNEPPGVVPVNETVQDVVRLLYTEFAISSATFYGEPANNLLLTLWQGFEPRLEFDRRLTILLSIIESARTESALEPANPSELPTLSVEECATRIKEALNALLADSDAE